MLGLLSVVATTRRVERGGRSVFCNFRKPGLRVGVVIENASRCSSIGWGGVVY